MSSGELLLIYYRNCQEDKNMFFHCSESMTSGEKEEIKGLGLPQCLEDSLCEMMEKSCLE